jgi:hypothetical protein
LLDENSKIKHKLFIGLPYNINMQHLLFLDLDGVLVDLVGGLSKRIGKELSYDRRKEFNEEFKTFIADLNFAARAEFWSNLPPTKDMELIWNKVKFYKPLILSSISECEAAAYGKQMWCWNNLAIDSRQVFCVNKSADKQNFACKNSMLIDDFDDNIAQFRAKGGQAIHHTNIDTTLSEFDNWVSSTWKYKQ